MMLMVMNIFVVSLTNKRCLALFPARAIIRDPHHHESTNLRNNASEFETKQNLSSGLVEWSSAVVITTTPLHRQKFQNKNFVKIFLPNFHSFCCSNFKEKIRKKIQCIDFYEPQKNSVWNPLCPKVPAKDFSQKNYLTQFYAFIQLK